MPQVRRASLNWPSTRSFSNPTHQGARTWVLSRKNVAPRCPSTNTANASRPTVTRSKPWACWKASGLPGLFFLSRAWVIGSQFPVRSLRSLAGVGFQWAASPQHCRRSRPIHHSSFIIHHSSLDIGGSKWKEEGTSDDEQGEVRNFLKSFQIRVKKGHTRIKKRKQDKVFVIKRIWII